MLTKSLWEEAADMVEVMAVVCVSFLLSALITMLLRP